MQQMNFRFFDDLVDSAPGTSQNFRFKKGQHSEKNYSSKAIERFLKNLHEILPFWKFNSKL